ncbi:MAG: DoxX-like family protein, partial [Sandaracinaceae bacterium]|nr:DoxX-like family protein [Sandaracinaceae bacterium]
MVSSGAVSDAVRRDALILRASLAMVWLLTAVSIAHPYYREVGEAELAAIGLPAWLMWATDLAELALAAIVLRGPSSTALTALQVGMVSSFTLILAIAHPMLIVSPFGMLSKNLQFVFVALTAWQLERKGEAERLERFLAAGMALVWITEGLLPKILFQQAVELSIAPEAGLDFVEPWILVGVVGVALLASGIAVLVLPRRPRAWLLFCQLAALVALPLVVGSIRPLLWV